jgi:Zn-dependent protease
MNGAFRLFTAFGIGVYVHWTFALLLLLALQSGYEQTGMMRQAVKSALLVLATFACVTLHEYGHALTARRFGIATRDITLLPFGGLARLERIPEQPAQEFWITLAGPAVNAVIFGVLYLGLDAADRWIDPRELLNRELPFFQMLAMINLMLVLFNLLPAFPMDGGRILRSILATRMDYVRATQIAAAIGRALAVALGLWALYEMQLFTAVMAFFLFNAAGAERQAAEIRAAMRAGRFPPI